MAKRERMESIKIQIPAGEMQIYRQLAKDYDMSIAAVFRAVTNGKLAEYLGKVRYVQPEQAKEIRQCLMDLGNNITWTRLEINRVGVNLNQVARVANETDQIEKMETIEAVRKTVLQALAKYDALTEEMGDVLCRIQA